MGKCKDVTEWQKRAIVFGRAHGNTVREVAGFVGVSTRTVQRVYKQWCNTHGHETRRQNCGRKTIFRPRDRQRVSRLVNANRFQTRQELLQSMNEGPSSLFPKEHCDRSCMQCKFGVRYLARDNCSQKHIKLHVSNGPETIKRGQ